MADVPQLPLIAKEEPQTALSTFNTGLSQRWKFIQQTVSDTKILFEPLERKIRGELIPAQVGQVPDTERGILSLPY